MVRRFVSSVWIVAALEAAGCSSEQRPLVIHMYNPKTHQALVCSARDQRPGAEPSFLAATVENCAKNLEAHGFIREK